MALEKPTWLQEWLKEHNYEFLGVNLYVGDWIESAIDWVLTPINFVIDWAVLIYDYVVDLRQEVIEWYDWLSANINSVMVWLGDMISAGWASLTEWWHSQIPLIMSWIDNAAQGLTDLKAAWDNFWTQTFPAFVDSLESIGSRLDYFFTQTLPGLLDVTWITTWWQSKLADIKSLIDSTLLDWFPDYNDLQELFSGVRDFFTDPLKWLYDRIEDFMDRWW